MEAGTDGYTYVSPRTKGVFIGIGAYNNSLSKTNQEVGFIIHEYTHMK